MTDTYELPPLPVSRYGFADPDGDGPDIPAFSADQMREYARAAIQRERERAAGIVQAEIDRAESLMALEEGGRPVFNAEQTEAGICALRTVAAAIRQGSPS